ncbi:HAD family hydrolase [Candidatus Parcubacteria bacterium]|nr:MAG: HAD family hydrolase [Candidatus Parcubacteria bacterium]
MSLQRANKATNGYTIIFDLDGTLYPIPGGSFHSSPIMQAVRKRAVQFIKKKLHISSSEAVRILSRIQKRYGEHISIGLEEKFRIPRKEYFQYSWNLRLKDFIPIPKTTKQVIRQLAQRYKLVLLSDAPSIWVRNALADLDITKYFSEVFSGESDVRKAYGNAIKPTLKKLNTDPRRAIMVGDQEATDILPAKRAGVAITILVNPATTSKHATASLPNINLLPEMLDMQVANLLKSEVKGVRKILPKNLVPTLYRAEPQEGSSHARTYRLSVIIRKGSLSKTQEDYNAYRELKNVLKKNYAEIFPNARIHLQKSVGFLELEDAGNTTLEKITLMPGTTNSILIPLLQRIAGMLATMQFASSVRSKKCNAWDLGKVLFREALSNLQGVPTIRKSLKKNYRALKSTLSHLQITSSPWHGDLSVVNIVLDKEGNITFIDPSMKLPRTKIKKCPQSTLVDYAALAVSLERKRRERQQRRYSDIKTSLLYWEDVCKRNWENNGIAAELIYSLACIFYASLYLNCRCNYCLHPSRKWMFSYTKKQLCIHIAQLTDILDTAKALS